MIRDEDGKRIGLRALAWHVAGVPFGIAGVIATEAGGRLAPWLFGMRDRMWRRSIVHRDRSR